MNNSQQWPHNMAMSNDPNMKPVEEKKHELQKNFDIDATAFGEVNKMLINRGLEPISNEEWYNRCMQYSMQPFDSDIHIMNLMMDLPIPEGPTVPTIERMVKFRNILIDEVNEINQIIEKLEKLKAIPRGTMDTEPSVLQKNLEVEIMADLSDVCADLEVYCASEMCGHGLSNSSAQMLVMNSNFTKLKDGKRVWNEELQKFEKGPNYIPPEPALMEMIQFIIDTPEDEEPAPTHLGVNL